MAWQTAPGMIIIVGGFSLVGALFAGVDGLNNWIYKKVSRRVRVGGCACGGRGGLATQPKHHAPPPLVLVPGNVLAAIA